MPAEKLDGTLGAIKKLATWVERENIGGKDVTEEYSDLNAELVNLEATEIELRELLTEVRQKTQKAEDVLKGLPGAHQSARRDRAGEGAHAEIPGQPFAAATVTIELIPDILAKPVVVAWRRPLETLKNAGRSLVNAVKGLVDIAESGDRLPAAPAARHSDPGRLVDPAGPLAISPQTARQAKPDSVVHDSGSRKDAHNEKGHRNGRRLYVPWHPLRLCVRF